MKRRAVVLIIICIVGLCLHFSRLICATDAQILLYIAKEKGIEIVDGLTLADIIISDDKTNALVICELGQPYVSRIFAWKFNVIASNLFIPSRGYTQNDEPWPIKTYIWDSKYIVIINDLSAKSYSVILDGQKKIEKIEICKSFFSKVLKLLAFQGVWMFLCSQFPLFFPLPGKNKGKSYCTLSSSFAASRLASLLACA